MTRFGKKLRVTYARWLKSRLRSHRVQEDEAAIARGCDSFTDVWYFHHNSPSRWNTRACESCQLQMRLSAIPDVCVKASFWFCSQMLKGVDFSIKTLTGSVEHDQSVLFLLQSLSEILRPKMADAGGFLLPRLLRWRRRLWTAGDEIKWKYYVHSREGEIASDLL